ncbi:uncharacterized protein LOC123317846 [Coccinella septempunctata]|uniref:uncharacterized protein LOC123317846 n=1 Tax=Coccinella septempunctata TaxID=41139 RepID=UPI001D0676D2|nr:uncharacterized protein LOC123317846 [Coccinella septempunctata]
MALRGYSRLRDFPDDLTAYDSLDEKHKNVLDRINILALEQCNRISNSNGRKLDLILVPGDESHRISLTGSEFPLISEDKHHPSLIFNITFNSIADKVDRNSENERWYYDFRRCNFYELAVGIRQIDWTPLFHHNNVNDALEFFYGQMYVWFNKDIFESMKRKKLLNKL